MKTILLATSNEGKRKEILSVLLPLAGIKIVTPENLRIGFDIDENGKNYRENALLKAKAYFEKTGLPTIAEDSGIEVSALKGELGMHTRRWGAGAKASDQEWLDFFMKRMAGEKDRTARFVCHSVYLDEKGPHHFEGECLGIITETPEAPLQPGIPLSAVFKPLGGSGETSGPERSSLRSRMRSGGLRGDNNEVIFPEESAVLIGESLVYSAMSEQQKNGLSHRGKAIKQLRNWLLKPKLVEADEESSNMANDEQFRKRK